MNAEVRADGGAATVSVLEARGLTKTYTSGFIRHRSVVAVEGIDLRISEGERVCLAGESGSGKTTLAKMLVGLVPPTAGSVTFGGRDLFSLGAEEKRSMRRKIQLIPQCPDLALDPTWFIYDSIAEPIRIHHLASDREDERRRIGQLCDMVELSSDHLRRKPRELSGGELQRAVIARSLSLAPAFIVADEPTSMLDPSIQAKIVHVLLRAQAELGFGYLFITHDLSLPRYVSDIILIMHGGRIVEAGRTHDVLSGPLHPYTSHLLSGRAGAQQVGNSPLSCSFYSGCAFRMKKCARMRPKAFQKKDAHTVRCWLYE